MMNIYIIIINFMGHNLIIIVVQNLLFISSYGIDIDVIHLLVLFEQQCYAHCLNTNVICLIVLFRHEYCVFIWVVYKQKSCTQLLCLNNAWHLYLNNANLWNNRFRMNLKRTHEIYTYYICHNLFHYVFVFSIELCYIK
jgi:hypothetical protein